MDKYPYLLQNVGALIRHALSCVSEQNYVGSSYRARPNSTLPESVKFDMAALPALGAVVFVLGVRGSCGRPGVRLAIRHVPLGFLVRACNYGELLFSPFLPLLPPLFFFFLSFFSPSRIFRVYVYLSARLRAYLSVGPCVCYDSTTVQWPETANLYNITSIHQSGQ